METTLELQKLCEGKKFGTGKMSIELDDCLIYQQSPSVTQYNYAASG